MVPLAPHFVCHPHQTPGGSGVLVQLALIVAHLLRSRTSTSKAVQAVWEFFLEILRLVPLEVRDDLHRLCHLEPDVHRAWEGSCKAAEVGLLSAHKAAGGPCPQGDQPFLGGGTAVGLGWLVVGLPVGSIGLLELTRWILPTVMSLSMPPLRLLFCSAGGSLGWCSPERYLEKWLFYCEVAGFDAPVGGCVQTGLHRLHEDCGSLEGLASP